MLEYFFSVLLRPLKLMSVLWLTTGVAFAADKPLTVAVGFIKPPYVINDSDTGFELDLVKAIFHPMGYALSFNYVPHARSYQMLKQGRVDIAMTLNHHVDIGDKAVLSRPYVIYSNVALSLKKNHLIIENIADLAAHSVVGFQQSRVVLGSEYNHAVGQSLHYLEIADQRKQVEMLMAGRTGVIVIDVNIFHFFSKALYGEHSARQVDIHWIFPNSPYRLGFRDSKLKQRFNQALAKYKRSVAYRKLVIKYRLFGVTEKQLKARQQSVTPTP